MLFSKLDPTSVSQHYYQGGRPNKKQNEKANQFVSESLEVTADVKLFPAVEETTSTKGLIVRDTSCCKLEFKKEHKSHPQFSYLICIKSFTTCAYIALNPCEYAVMRPSSK